VLNFFVLFLFSNTEISNNKKNGGKEGTEKKNKRHSVEILSMFVLKWSLGMFFFVEERGVRHSQQEEMFI